MTSLPPPFPGSPPPEPATFRLHRLSLIPPGLTLLVFVVALILVLTGTVGFDIRALTIGFAAVVRIVMVVTTRVTVTPTQVRAKWGWIWTADKSIPMDRVQDVQIERSITARILGLTQVEINSAGGAGSIKLSYFDHAGAERIKALLHAQGLQATTGPNAATAGRVEQPERPLHTVSLAEIVRSRIGTGLALAGVALVSLIVGLAAEPIALLGVLAALVLFAASIISTWINYGQGESAIAGDLLRLRQGLFTLRTTSTPRARVQVMSSTQGPVFQLLGYEKIQYASADATIDTAQRIRQVIAPGAPSGLLPPAAIEVLGVRVPETTALVPLGRSAFRGSIARSIELSVIVLAFAAALAVLGVSLGVSIDTQHRVAAGSAFGVGFVLIVAIALVFRVIAGAIVGFVRSRRSAFGFGPECFVSADGFAIFSTSVVPLGKVQAVEIIESPGQRFVGVASVQLDVAGASGRWKLRVVDLDRNGADELAESLTAAAGARALPDGV